MTVKNFEIFVDTLGHLLRDSHLRIPMYQRDYSWTNDELNEYFTDLSNVIDKKDSEYFFGSVVVAKIAADGSSYDLIDGQQRLTTTSIFIAAVRDFLVEQNEAESADIIEKEYLFSKVLRTKEIKSHLVLNLKDNSYYN